MGDVHSFVERNAVLGRPARSGTSLSSIVVPVYDEMHRLPAALPQLLELATANTELILVDDGSRDGTGKLLASIRQPNVTVLRLPRNRGKGAAVRAGASIARGHSVAFMDADLATDIACLEPLLEALKSAHVAIGSRAHPQSVVHDATRRRSRMGGQFNRLTRHVTGTRYCDTQCGFKAFRAEVAGLLFHLARVNGFAFDVELLCLARTLHMRVAEVPVVWTERPGSKIRLLRDPARMAFDVVATRMRSPADAPITLCCVDPHVENPESTARLLHRQVRSGDIVAAADREVCIYLPGISASGAESVMARMRTVLPGAEARIAFEPTRKAWRSFECQRAPNPPSREARPAVIGAAALRS